jgi:hypothetical protein
MDDLLQIDDFKPHVGLIFSFKGTRHALPLVKQDSSRRTAASRLFC